MIKYSVMLNYDRKKNEIKNKIKEQNRYQNDRK